MKTLNFLKYFLFVVLGATLMFSCSDDESDNDLLESESTIVLRTDDDGIDGGGDFDPDCIVTVCATIIPSADPFFVDVYTVQIPGVGSIQISDNMVTLFDGTVIPLVDNQFCADIPLFGASTAILSFKGYGGVEVTGEWENGAVCPLFSAIYDGTTKAPLFATEEVELTCESPCPPPPDCFIEVCATIIEEDPSDVFFINYPTIGVLKIKNGVVTLPDGSIDYLVDNQYCATIPLFDPTTVLISFYGFGSAVVTAEYESGEVCEVYTAGVDYDGYVHICENVTLTCEPPCPPPPTCFVEVCATLTPSATGDDLYFVTLPSVGIIQIANGIITLPDGSTQPLINNQFCTQIPLFDEATAHLNFLGSGAVEVTAEWANGAICPIFEAGVGTDEFVIVCEEVTLTCESTCPPPPECFVTVCAEFNQGSNTDLYSVQIPNVGVLTIQNGWVTLPGGGQVPLVGNTFCADIPIFAPSTAVLSFKGVGSVVTTGIWEDGTTCQLFSAGVGTNVPVKVSDNVELSCEPPCPQPETCTIEICANFSPATDDDLYQVTLPGGGIIKIQGGIVTLPNGDEIPYNGYQFCADIEIAVGTTETATLSFKGTGEVFTTITYSDGGNCTVFSAGQGTSSPVKKSKSITLGCDPIC